MKKHSTAESCTTSCGDLGFHQYHWLGLSFTKEKERGKQFGTLGITQNQSKSKCNEWILKYKKIKTV